MCTYQRTSPQAGGSSLRGPLDVVEEVHETDKVSDELLGLSRGSLLPLAKLGGLIGEEKVATAPVLLRLGGERK